LYERKKLEKVGENQRDAQWAIKQKSSGFVFTAVPLPKQVRVQADPALKAYSIR